ncbi:uncharacterized protein LOC108632040 isoform X2 [Ceratina calcarata]|uniref:Uncharacterized protein LOC108632040 isoform X2 n=1 Tax=Ceratina calcarata TaxID=156304 RepID=A0AAJ7JFU6_9HYME|nr:uncharacterized protein LOC108632040 isoform X2 [Ceratina calcarata]
MASQIRFLSLFFLFALLTTGFARSLDCTEQDDSNDSLNDEKVSANINKVFDSLLPAIKNMILRHGLDPLKLGDISEKLPGVINHSRVINLSNGWFQGLSNLKRGKDIIMSYENKILTIDAYLQFDLLGFDYEYVFKDLLITRKGDIHGSIKNMQMRVVVGVDWTKYKLIFERAEIINIGTLDIKLVGNILDPVLNAAIKAITKIFHRRVVEMVEKQVAVVLESLLDKINDKIPQPDSHLILNDIMSHSDALFPLLFRMM